MGNFFIEYFDNSTFIYHCKICNSHISHKNYITNNTVETSIGSAIGLSFVMNVICLNKTYSTYTYHDTFDIFDNDSILTNTGECLDMYCKKCNNFIGWKHMQCNAKHKYIILKNSIN